MSLRFWLRSLRAQFALSKTVRRVKADSPRAMQLAESLEPRCLLAVTPLVVNGTELIVQLETADNVVIQSDSAGKLEVLSNNSVVIGNPDILTANITSIMVNGGDGSNSIDLTGVTTADFDAALTITVNGGDGNDTILGSEFADSLFGGNGNDSIDGGLDADTIDGGNGADVLNGGVDNDSLLGGDGTDLIHGDAGDDTVVAGNGADQAFGDDGLDSLNGGDGRDTISGDAGDDIISGDNGNDSLLGGDGNDVLLGGFGNDTASGGDGLDTLSGNGDNDSLSGDAGTDSIDGGVGDDVLSGGDVNDTLNGSAGNDTIDGGDGADSLFGGSGNDSLFGGSGDDSVFGQSDNDTLLGGTGADSLDGGDGNDLVRGVVPALFINDFTIAEPDSGTAPMTFTVVLSSPSTSTVTVDYATASGTAIEGRTFTRATGQLTFSPGIVSQTITVFVIGDTNVEPDETFFVNLTNAVNAPIGDSQGLGTIVDNDLTSSFGVPIVNVAGQSGGAQPPDTVGDVGLNHYVQAVNGPGGTRVQIFDKAGTPIGGPFTLSSLAPAGASVVGRGDPSVVYDQLADRWLLAEFSAGGVGSTNEIYMYVSRTGTPTNNPVDWVLYEFTAPQFPDYLKFGVWPDGYYMSSNESSPAVYVFDRTNMLLGLPAQPFQRFTGPSLAGFGFQAFTPVDIDGFVTPAGGNPAYFVRHRDDEAHNVGSNNPTQDFLELWQLDVDFTIPANSSFTQVGGNIPISEFDSSIGGLFAFSGITQPAPGPSLDPIREVVMYRSFYRNFGTHESIVGNFVTDPTFGLDQGGVRWFELRRVGGGAWTLFQEGTISPDTDNRWIGAIAMNGNGEIAVGYNVAGPTTFPGLRYSGRRASDPVGTMPNGENVIFNGTGIQVTNRWGDYAAMSVDPSDDRTFWFTGEYATGGNFGTRVMSFAFPSAASPGATGFPSFIDVGDTLLGGNGNDTLEGADGDDLINGMGGNDSLIGGAGNDVLFGGSGSDTLDGGLGDDTLDGQGGNDLVAGGDGSDMYVWNGVGDGKDTLSSLSGYDSVFVKGTNVVNNYVVSQNSGQLTISDGSAELHVSSVIQVVTISAGGGNDTITINALDRVKTAMLLTVDGGGGNDLINSNGANVGFVRVSLIGGNGDDTLIGSGGIDSLDGGDGDDSLDAQGGDDLIFGGNGDDTILAGAGDDRVFAGDGDDVINAGDGNDSVVGDLGADTISGSDGHDTLDGGDGADVINGGDGDDSILGGNEADNLNGSLGNDTIHGGASDDTISGENGTDKLYGDDGNDSIQGYSGDDTINGGDGDDTLDGGVGFDLISGGNGDDILNGAADNDTLSGGDGNDTLAGGAGQDVLLGGEGDDSLNGQGSTDIINSGEGTDTIVGSGDVIDTTYVLSAALLAALA